jgi:hypothetical protein
MRGADFIADYFTSVEEGIAYAGATSPRLGVFVVDTAGSPRAFVGPVAHAYEVHTPLETRLTDKTATKLTKVDDPWAQSYTIANPAAEPTLQLTFDEHGDVEITSPDALGMATIKILNHHRNLIATKRQLIKKGDTTIAFHRKTRVNAVYLQIGEFSEWAVGDSYGSIIKRWGKLAESDDADD